jgi:hypothetical protein
MRKSLVMMMLIGLSIGVFNTVCHGVNLVENSNFESITQDLMPAGWIYNPGRNSQATLSLDRAERKSGNHSLKISVENPLAQVNLAPARESLGKPVPGKTYELSFWIKTQNLSANQMKVSPAVRLNFRPTRALPLPIIEFDRVLDSTSPWQQLTMVVTAPADAEEFTLDFTMTRGVVWIDEIILRSVD